MRKWWLFLVYYLVVTPYGLVSRVVRDPLQRRWEPRRTSYFTPLEHPAGRDRRRHRAAA